MFGPFKPTSPLMGGLLWKRPWRLSSSQKRRQRKRLRLVDNVINTITSSLRRHNIQQPMRLERWVKEMPTEGEMKAKDKYTIFDRKARGYRKGVHKLPKWTRVSQRVNPPGF